MPDEDGELFVLQHSIGALILWPRALMVNVQVDSSAPTKGKELAKSRQKRGRSLTPSNLKKESLPRSLKQLLVITKVSLACTGDLISIDMSELVFGPTMPEIIGTEEIKHVIKQQEIRASMISKYIRAITIYMGQMTLSR